MSHTLVCDVAQDKTLDRKDLERTCRGRAPAQPGKSITSGDAAWAVLPLSFVVLSATPTDARTVLIRGTTPTSKLRTMAANNAVLEVQPTNPHSGKTSFETQPVNIRTRNEPDDYALMPSNGLAGMETNFALEAWLFRTAVRQEVDL